MSEIRCIFGLNFFQISDLTFVVSEFKILFLQCTTKVARHFLLFLGGGANGEIDKKGIT